MQVKDFMIRDVITARPDTTIKELLTLFVERRIGGVPVVDAAQKLVGMISDGDIIRYLAPRKGSVHDLFYSVYYEEAENEQEVLTREMNTPAADVMHKKHLYTVKQDDDFENVIRLLSEHRFKKLPVLNDEGRVIGVISRGDILHNLSKMLLAKDRNA